MQLLNRRHALFLAVATSATAIGLASASAQLIPNAAPGVGTAGMPKAGDQSSQGKAPAPPPDAIPGARARQPVAPATKSANDMNPTDALFDAIDRGDIAAARDALNRGADLNGINVLGMTPMELSVDLGRNDISFLLLSMRGDDPGRGSRASAKVGQPSLSGKPGVAAKAPAPGHKTAAAAKGVAAPAKVAAEKPAALPKLWSNDGGAPQPNAGFLGFGSSRQASN